MRHRCRQLSPGCASAASFIWTRTHGWVNSEDTSLAVPRSPGAGRPPSSRGRFGRCRRADGGPGNRQQHHPFRPDTGEPTGPTLFDAGTSAALEIISLATAPAPARSLDSGKPSPLPTTLPNSIPLVAGQALLRPPVPAGRTRHRLRNTRDRFLFVFANSCTFGLIVSLARAPNSKLPPIR